MLIAKSNIKFRSYGELFNYNPGDKILPKHEHMVKFYYSGQVVDENLIRFDLLNLNEKPENQVVFIKDSDNDVIEDIDNLNISTTIEEKCGKKDMSQITIDNIPIVPKDDTIQMTGSVGESTSEGPDIKHKVGKINKVKNG